MSPASLRASTAAIVNVDDARDDLDARRLHRLARLGARSSARPRRCAPRARRAARSRIAARSCAGSGSRIARSAASSACSRLGRAALARRGRRGCRRTASEPRASRRSRPTRRRSGASARSPSWPLRESRCDASGLDAACRARRCVDLCFRPMAERRVHRRCRSLSDREAERVALRDPRGRARRAGPERPRRAGSTSIRARSRTSRWAA